MEITVKDYYLQRIAEKTKTDINEIDFQSLILDFIGEKLVDYATGNSQRFPDGKWIKTIEFYKKGEKDET